MQDEKKVSEYPQYQQNQQFFLIYIFFKYQLVATFNGILHLLILPLFFA